MIKIIYRSVRNEQPKLLTEYKIGSWVHIEDAQGADIEKVAHDLNLDLNNMKDAMDPFEVSRIEQDNGVQYIFARFAYHQEGHIFTTPLLVIIAPDYFVTVAREKLPLMERFDTGQTEFFTTQKTKLFIQLFLLINNEYQKLINEMRKNVRHTTVNVEKIQNKDILKLVNIETIFNDFLSSLQPAGITLEKLMSGKYLKLYEADTELVEDLLVGTRQLVEMSVTNLKAIANFREAYSTIVSNNLNKTMKLLTAVTLILTIPTMIASFFGMNVGVPFSSHPLAFTWIVVATIGLSMGLIIVFWKKDYL